MSESHAAAPPVLPPKPNSQDASRINTPTSAANPTSEVDPGEEWLPAVLRDKSYQDLADILSSPALLDALTHSPTSSHPSVLASHRALDAALADNAELAGRLADAEAHLSRQRSVTQAALLSVHALERQWRQRQADMDTELARFSPAALYQLLSQRAHEQELVCQAMEESFFEADNDEAGGPAVASEREVAEWVKRYREAKVLCYLRHERKERWDAGRVGGWR